MPETPEARQKRLKDLADFEAADARAKAKAPSKAAVSKPAAPKPTAKPAADGERSTPEEQKVVRRALRDILAEREKDVMDVVDEAVTGAKNANPDY